MDSRTVKRIADVSTLRTYQFPQYAGLMAHPVQPHSYIKGAEVVRMYKTLLGSSGFRKGMNLYFERHYGHAVTCEDFFAAMKDANGADFSNFLLWYSQDGTPCLRLLLAIMPNPRLILSSLAKRFVPPTPGQPVKEPMFIRVALGLLGSDGKDMPLSSAYYEGKLESLTENGQVVHTTVLRVTTVNLELRFLK